MERYVTAKQLADVLSVSTRTVRRWGRHGRIPSVEMTGCTIRYPKSAVEAKLREMAGSSDERLVSDDPGEVVAAIEEIIDSMQVGSSAISTSLPRLKSCDGFRDHFNRLRQLALQTHREGFEQVKAATLSAKPQEPAKSPEAAAPSELHNWLIWAS